MGALDLLFESDLDTCWLKELLFSAKFGDFLKKDENVALILEVFEEIHLLSPVYGL